MIETAVILAAGKGTRLQAADELPKPLQIVGGIALIRRTIRSLAGAGVRRVIVVTGYKAELVAAVAAESQHEVEILIAHNAEFEKSNGISVQVGGAMAGGPFLLSMADHIYPPAIARLVGSQDLGAAELYLATDPRLDTILDIADATKVKSEHGRIVAIGKELADYDRIDCGVFCVTPRLLDKLAIVRAERGDCSLTEGVRLLAADGVARVVDIGAQVWIDVDTPADRAAAEALLTS